jgi:hypothetical protein
MIFLWFEFIVSGFGIRMRLNAEKSGQAQSSDCIWIGCSCCSARVTRAIRFFIHGAV